MIQTRCDNYSIYITYQYAVHVTIYIEIHINQIHEKHCRYYDRKIRILQMHLHFACNFKWGVLILHTFQVFL